MAGKTTSVRALASGLGVQASAPAEVDGRTLYFDWLEYTGGLFEGRRIRCQVISVPGQTVLASRRRYLIESADVVVFVGDSTPEAQPSALGYLKGLHAVLEKVEGPPVGIVLQANKRDHVDAVPITQFREALDAIDLRVAIIESIATQGVGIRETFVFAVRLALDRVRELMRSNALPTMRPKTDSSEELLRELHRVEGDSLNLAAASGLTQTRLSSVLPSAMAASALDEAVAGNTPRAKAVASVPPPAADAANVAPSLPSSTLPSGMIWPPVNGRLILHDATANQVDLELDANGDWVGRTSGHWKIHSPKPAQFATLDQGREALIKWARLHAASTHVISAQRCVVLAEDGLGHYRLWQIVRADPSLRDEFSAALAEGPDAIAASLLTLPRQLLQAAERWNGAACWLPLKLTSVGTATAGGCYLGRMPDPLQARPVERRSLPSVLGDLALEIEFAVPALRPQRNEALMALRRMTEAKAPGPGQIGLWGRRFLEAL